MNNLDKLKELINEYVFLSDDAMKVFETSIKNMFIINHPKEVNDFEYQYIPIIASKLLEKIEAKGIKINPMYIANDEIMYHHKTFIDEVLGFVSNDLNLLEAQVINTACDEFVGNIANDELSIHSIWAYVNTEDRSLNLMVRMKKIKHAKNEQPR